MYFKMFKTFFMVGAFTLGGGLAMVPVIEKEVVEKNHWITDEEFLDALTVAQSVPGVMAVNISTYIGYKIKGFPGALLCALGAISPAFVMATLVGTVFFEYRNHPLVVKAFMGIRPVIASLLLASVVSVARKSKLNGKQYFIAIAVALLIFILKVSPIYLILIGGIGYVLLDKYVFYRK